MNKSGRIASRGGAAAWRDDYELSTGRFTTNERLTLIRKSTAFESGCWRANRAAQRVRHIVPRNNNNNGRHAGFIMYMTDTAQNETDVAALRSALKSAKGPGNLRNLFMYEPGGKKDSIN